MKWAEREKWHKLKLRLYDWRDNDEETDEPTPEQETWDVELCHLCRYAEWSGSGIEGDGRCTHPLPVISETDKFMDAWSGMDCWAFRPLMTLKQARMLEAAGGLWDGYTVPVVST